jgi:hypothetical protein
MNDYKKYDSFWYQITQARTTLVIMHLAALHAP